MNEVANDRLTRQFRALRSCAHPRGGVMEKGEVVGAASMRDVEFLVRRVRDGDMEELVHQPKSGGVKEVK